MVAATLVFFWQYYRRTLAGAFAVIISFIGLALILRPLDTGTVDLLAHNMVNRSLITESYQLLGGKEDIRLTNISTQVRENTVLVRADLVAARALSRINLSRNYNGALPPASGTRWSWNSESSPKRRSMQISQISNSMRAHPASSVREEGH